MLMNSLATLSLDPLNSLCCKQAAIKTAKTKVAANLPGTHNQRDPWSQKLRREAELNLNLHPSLSLRMERHLQAHVPNFNYRLINKRSWRRVNQKLRQWCSEKGRGLLDWRRSLLARRRSLLARGRSQRLTAPAGDSGFIL